MTGADPGRPDRGLAMGAGPCAFLEAPRAGTAFAHAAGTPAMRLFAWLIGMANPTPCAPLACAVITPITLPEASRSGPPLFPGLMAASVWMSPLSRVACPEAGSVASMLRPSAETMPLVTVSLKVPSGLPRRSRAVRR